MVSTYVFLRSPEAELLAPALGLKSAPTEEQEPGGPGGDDTERPQIAQGTQHQRGALCHDSPSGNGADPGNSNQLLVGCGGNLHRETLWQIGRASCRDRV